MFFNTLLVFATISSSAFLNAHAHGAMTGVTGANGVQAAGFGIVASTPRNGATPNPFEQDTSVIRNNAIASGKTGVCGSTKIGGNNDVATQLAAASQAGLPTAAADGTVTMTIHQVNQDGAGPYTCDVSGDGGNTFVAAPVTTNVPGKFGLSLATATDFPLVAQMPAGMACTAGPNGDACIMRCREWSVCSRKISTERFLGNPALAGPFGGCAAIASGTASNATAAAAAPAAAAAAPAAAAPATAAAAPAAAAAAPAAAAAAPAAAAAAPAAAAAAPAAAASTKKGGLAGLLGGLGGLGGKKAARGPAKRHIVSRVAGKRSGFWLDNQ
ncbi:hypothetical protein C8R44DRAFT_852117 [Mycena epipterygia]|nr:hypothetical protein C8R44DRAFT_852117 [Mycena epipterygia]